MQFHVIAESHSRLRRRFGYWGLSFLINGTILFDTFSHGRFLIRSMLRNAVDPKTIRHIILSHDHWDHVNGIFELLRYNNTATVYIGSHFSNETKQKLSTFSNPIQEISNQQLIAGNIFSSGEMHGIYNKVPIFEQSLYHIGSSSTIIITGCAHPPLTTIVQHIQKYIPKHHTITIIGGFHWYQHSTTEINTALDSLHTLGVRTLAPCHCTGRLATKIISARTDFNLIPITTSMRIEL